MACILASGIALGCKDSLGGIKEAYIGSFSSATTYTYDADDIIDTVTLGANFFTFAQRNEQGEFVQTGNHSVENGTNFWTQSVSLIFSKNDADNRNVLKVLAQSTLTIIVKDQNDLYWLIGQENGADLVASTIGAGKAYGDLNGSTVSFEGKEKNSARVMSQVAFDSLTVA
tara:strand:- start:2790 stop:3302 length:513 start_codon:yes stop_codon:yes gene_type:complete